MQIVPPKLYEYLYLGRDKMQCISRGTREGLVVNKWFINARISGGLITITAKKSGNFGLKSNGKVIFQKKSLFGNCGLPPEVILFFPLGTEWWKLPYHLHGFPVPVSCQQKTITGIKPKFIQMVSTIIIIFGWFADFGKSLAITQWSSHPVPSVDQSALCGNS